MACDVGDDGDLARFQDSSSRLSAAFPGAAGYFSRFVVNTATYSISTLASPNLFHWLTQGFWLRHPTISLGHARVLTGVRDKPGSPDGLMLAGWGGSPTLACWGGLGHARKPCVTLRVILFLRCLFTKYQLPSTLFFSFQRANSFPRPEAEVF